MLLEPGEFEKAVFYISVDRKSRLTCDCQVFKFLLLYSVDGKLVMHFQSENTVFKFLWPSVSLRSDALEPNG